MPKPTKKIVVQKAWFRWLLGRDRDKYCADGRSNQIKLGRYALTATSMAEAMEELNELDLSMAIKHGLADRSLLLATKQGKLTLAKGRDLYLAFAEQKTILNDGSPKTPLRYRVVFDKFIPYCCSQGVSFCDQVTDELVERYWVALKTGEIRSLGGKRGGRPTKEFAQCTINLEVTTIKQFIGYLINEGHLHNMSRLRLKVSKNPSSDRYCYKPEEVAAILGHCKAGNRQWFGALLTTLVYTGLRIGEALSLRWSDIDFANSRISLTDERYSRRRKAKGKERRLKGKKSRSFPIHPDLAAVLMQIPPSSDDIVFHGAKGGKLKYDDALRYLVSEVIRPLSNRFPTPPGEIVGFVDARFHSFRHYFCSACSRSGVSEFDLMKWMGHADSEMVRYYYHLNNEQSQAAMDRVNFVPKAAMERDSEDA